MPRRYRQNASAFTFGHNLIESGYPIIEAIKAVAPSVSEIVFVDMQSTDDTFDTLMRLNPTLDVPLRIIPGKWKPGLAGECLRRAHDLHCECTFDTIWHFEADEVYDESLCVEIERALRKGITDLAVMRIQCVENFQRVRWYPEAVHRIFAKGVTKQGHTTREHLEGWDDRYIETLPVENGYLWDVAVGLRDDVIPRMRKQAELWGHPPTYRFVPLHFMHPIIELTDEEDVRVYLEQEHWVYQETPFVLPNSLLDLVGQTHYLAEVGDV